MLEIKRILFPVDFTENSAKILPYVLSVAGKYDATIYLLHVVDDFCKWGGFYIPHIPAERFQDAALKGAEETLDRVCEEQLQRCPNFQKKDSFRGPCYRDP